MSLQSLSVATRQRCLQFHQSTSSCVLNADVFASIIQLTDPATMAQCRLVSHAFDRLSIPILVRSVTLKRSGEKAITFCRFMLEGSGRAFLLSVRQLLVYPAACVFSRTAFPPWTDVPSFLSLRHSLLDVITAAKELTLLRFVASSDALLEPHDPESHPECTPHRHLSYMELETMSKPIHPTFLLVQHLSLSLFSFSPSLEREIRVLTVFPALRSFSGPTSAFVSLSFHHQLEFVRLREHRFDCGRPAWIGSDNEVDDVLRAISRVPARSIAIGINILDDEGLASSFWGQLAGVAPLLEDLAVTMSYHDYMVSTSIAVSLSLILSTLGIDHILAGPYLLSRSPEFFDQPTSCLAARLRTAFTW